MFSFILIAILVTAINVESASSEHSSLLQGVKTRAKRITGGDYTEIKDRPFQVGIYYMNEFKCGGVIISKDYVLTAAMQYAIGGWIYKDQITIRAGSNDRFVTNSSHQISEAIVHENFKFNKDYYENDIAVFKVKKPFEFDETISPVELFEADEDVKAGADAVVSGWGLDPQNISIVLKNLTLPILSKQECKKKYNYNERLREGQICTYLAGKGPCPYDNGGPLTVDGRLAGVVSRVFGCGLLNYPSIYTEVSHYRDWIRNKTNV